MFATLIITTGLVLFIISLLYVFKPLNKRLKFSIITRFGFLPGEKLTYFYDVSGESFKYSDENRQVDNCIDNIIGLIKAQQPESLDKEVLKLNQIKPFFKNPNISINHISYCSNTYWYISFNKKKINFVYMNNDFNKIINFLKEKSS